MIENKVLKTVQECNMIKPGEKVLVGISGGVDSTALIIALNHLKDRLNIKLYAAHLNHKIRGRQSDLDAEYVRDLTKKLKVPCTAEEFDVPRFAKQNRLNLEDAARKIRYEFFERVAARVGADKIAVGHTADDNVETFLMRLIRGSGMRGLEGIPQVRGKIIRPLIGLFRCEIMEYLMSKKIKPRIDRTNYSTKLLRNRIRLNLIPALKRYNGRIKEILLHTIHAVVDDRSFIESKTREALAGVAAARKSGEIKLDKKKFLALHPSLRAGVLRAAIEYVKKNLADISFVHIEDILNLAGRKGELDLPGVYVLVDKKAISVSKAKPERFKLKPFAHTLEIPGQVEIDEAKFVLESELIEPGRPLNLKMKNPYQAYVDYDKIGKPLIVRSRKAGDVFSPLGLRGTKKLQDVFVDEKVEAEERDKIPILEDGEKIVWVVGYRVSERAKVTGKTKKVVRLTAKPI